MKVVAGEKKNVSTKVYYAQFVNRIYSLKVNFLFQSKTIREFDSKFTVKQFGFKDVDEYYRSATLHDKLHKIQVPVLCLSAADDPFQPLDGKFFYETGYTTLKLGS